MADMSINLLTPPPSARKRKFEEDDEIVEVIPIDLTANVSVFKQYKRKRGGSSRDNPIFIGDVIASETESEIIEVSDDDDASVIDDVVFSETQRETVVVLDDDDDSVISLDDAEAISIASEDDVEVISIASEDDVEVISIASEDELEELNGGSGIINANEDTEHGRYRSLSLEALNIPNYQANAEDTDEDEGDQFRGFLDWTHKDKPSELLEDAVPEVPELSSSQETVDSEGSEVPPLHRRSLNNLRLDQLHLSSQGEKDVNSEVEKKECAKPVALQNFASTSQATNIPTEIDTERIREKERKEASRRKKRLFFYESYLEMLPHMQKRLDSFLEDLPMSRTDDECWLYPGPRLRSGRTIRIPLSFRHGNKRFKVNLHIGFVSLLVEGVMTDEQKEGIIEEAWHASHLCGNWTCINWHHIVPEPGSTNVNRNPCFRKVDEPCTHTPHCRKHLKVDLALLRPDEPEPVEDACLSPLGTEPNFNGSDTAAV